MELQHIIQPIHNAIGRILLVGTLLKCDCMKLHICPSGQDAPIFSTLNINLYLFIYLLIYQYFYKL